MVLGVCDIGWMCYWVDVLLGGCVIRWMCYWVDVLLGGCVIGWMYIRCYWVDVYQICFLFSLGIYQVDISDIYPVGRFRCVIGWMCYWVDVYQVLLGGCISDMFPLFIGYISGRYIRYISSRSIQRRVHTHTHTHRRIQPE